MYVTPSETLKARKKHICTSCGEAIEPGTEYKRWASVDDYWSTNKMHIECYDMHAKEAKYRSYEYTPYSYERPKPD